MDGFGVALDYNDLSHLVLSDPIEWEVALKIAEYLSKYGTAKPIFSLRDEKATFDVGRRIANSSSDLVAIWNEEENDAACRVKGHRGEVLRKQELARKLRKEIADLEVQRADANRKLTREQAELASHEQKLAARNSWNASSHDIAAYSRHSHSTCKTAVQRLSSTVSSLGSQLASKNSSLKSALKAPPPVFQPLPRDRSSAMPIIFFLHMPPIFRLLSRFCFTSQQLLLPHPWNAAWAGSEGVEKTDITKNVTQGSSYCQFSWTDYYNSKKYSPYHSPNSTKTGSDYSLRLRSQADIVPAENQVGHQSVDYMTNDDDGIWWPDNLKPRMAWLGGPKSFDHASCGSEINPFAKLDHFIIASGFTERLTKDSVLQWTLVQPGEEHIHRSRANLPYARQNIKIDWLSKTQYFSFANLRAYPDIQLRNILIAIQERQLPFTEPAVQVLVKQALFHIGKISFHNGSPSLDWKQDLNDPYFGKDAHRIFESFCNEIRNSPKSYLCVKIIAKLCNFFSKWEPRCRALATQLAESVVQWAADLDGEVEKSPPAMAPALRSKQVVLYQHAILAVVGGSNLERKDVALLIKMVVQAKNCFTGDNRLDEMRENDIEIKYEMGLNTNDIIRACSQYPAMLTDALRSVYQRCPDSLAWVRWCSDNGAFTQCFQSKDNEGHYFSVNILSGEVLIDGLPPSRLPQSILDSPVYTRTFRDRNFEVVEKGEFLETRHPFNDRFYRFTKRSPLKIYEFMYDESEMLELLDATSEDIPWARELPERLLRMHSHWLSRDKCLLVVRGVEINDRDISFLVELKSDCGNGVEGRVKCIDLHNEQRESFSALLKGLPDRDTLVLQQQSKALAILAKFEPAQYIHSLVDASKEFRFFLPRYSLTFVVLNGELHCREIAGYKLQQSQQINGTFRGIKRYLVLVGTRGDGKLIILPLGKVVRERPGQVHLQVTNCCDERLMWYQYKFHPRFKHLETKQSLASRLQLAALHIATSSNLPDEVLGMTGEERAVTLLRQCWGNRPLNKKECLVLDNIKQLAAGMSPTVSLLCRDIEVSASSLSFLHPDAVKHDHISTSCFEDAAYLNNVRANQVSHRCHLTRREETRLFGYPSRKPTLPPRFSSTREIIADCPVSTDEVGSLQIHLDCFQSKNLRKAKKPKLHTFPLKVEPSSNLEKDMMNELKESWDAHIHSCSSNIDSNVDVRGLSWLVTHLREKAEEFVLRVLNDVPSPAHWHDDAHRALQIAGLVPAATSVDLARIAVDPSLIKAFNPMLSQKSREKLLGSILVWLRLCVYEDKISRLETYSESGLLEEVQRELETKTVWSAPDHPYWLVFEVENGIQIRQEQYKVAKHLIDHPGDVIQLNMGLGKTRVILPMLVLHASMHDGFCARTKVTRLHFLSALFQEAYNYLQHHLSASILEIKIYSMPFCRDYQLDPQSVATMKLAIDECRLEGGALVVAPEHRLSLELKAKELYRSGNEDLATSLLEGIIETDVWYDVLDECDELLRHRYQLIYAIGTAAQLPNGPNRWRAIEAVFSALAFNDGVKKYLASHPRACKLSTQHAAEWPAIQFFDGEPLSDMLGDSTRRRSPRLEGGLLHRLADGVLNDPPHELEWMRGHPLQDEIKHALVQNELHPSLSKLPVQQKADVLALRGFLVGGILRHCLLKRHRVEYGVSKQGKKRLAVPFRFADTPDERSEFAHPDCAIAFTILSYYHNGLTRAELTQSVKTLLTLGANAQRCFYSKWFDASSTHIVAERPECFESLNRVEKIDVSNEAQLEDMWHFFHRNMHTINFYLNCCVFPVETVQFDSRLTATSWNLAQNPSGLVIGFSGTNDNHRILPLQVRQFFASKKEDADPVLKHLDGTNGKMVEMILNHTLAVRKLEAGTNRFQSLLDLIIDGIKGSMPRMHAIIDCGALLAGTDLHVNAKKILSILPTDGAEFGGVLYYDSDMFNDWVVLERSGRILPKDLSPVKEDNVFAVFDEPRCRGSDLKLRADASAMITLAPKVCKDKFMQAAGRLRKLGRNQKLVIAGGLDVFSKLDSGSNPGSLIPQETNTLFDATPAQVLTWAMKNTVKSTAAGILNWASQGFFFASTFRKDPCFCVTDEILELDDMYGSSFAEQTVVNTAREVRKYYMKRTGGEEELHDSVKGMVESICNRINEYGCDFTCSARGCEEECERELEMEVEEEEEVEVQVPLMTPRLEKQWSFETALNCQSPTELSSIAGVKALSAFVAGQIKPEALASIRWCNKIHCTENFAQTIVCGPASALNSFLRVVNSMLLFPDGSLLLLSEFEANSFLKLFWKGGRLIRSDHKFLHTSLLRQSLDISSETALVLCASSPRLTNLLGGRLERGFEAISDATMASLQLFAGECSYATKERKEALKSMLRVRKAGFCPRAESERMVEMRGLGKLYPYSDIEKVSDLLLCEL